MIKKCIGCGVSLQETDKENLGYTSNLKNDYCMRCFRLKNYGEKNKDEIIDENKIIEKVNKSKGLVFFLIDYLNLNKETLDIFKKIKLKKVLVVSKSDVLRNDMKFLKIKLWLKQVYGVTEDILFISNRNDFKNVNIFKYMDKEGVKVSFIMGITNAGKSTFINSILKSNRINKEIVESNKPNTTLDFIKIRVGDYIIYDTPGFLGNKYIYGVINKEIKPITYQIKKDTKITINDNIVVGISGNNSVTFYLVLERLKKEFKADDKLNAVEVPENSDIVFPGIGFMNVKEKTIIRCSEKNLEVRSSISGVDYE